MALVDFDSFLKKEVITQDAYILGEVMDIRYDIRTWNVMGLALKTGSDTSSVLNVGSGKSKILLGPGRYIVNQVILTDGNIDSARTKIAVDNDSNYSVSKLEGMKIYSADNQIVGEVCSVDIDIDNWVVSSFIVKLDKTAYPLLDVKKGLFGKKVGGITAPMISALAEDKITLALDMESIKNTIIVL